MLGRPVGCRHKAQPQPLGRASLGRGLDGARDLRGNLLADVAEDVRLGWEVGEEGALADVGGLGDLGDGDLVEAALNEQPHGLGNDALAGGGATTGCPGLHE